MKFIVIGLGSIGTRHKHNLESIGHEVIPCHRSDDLSQLIKMHQPAGVLICNPTSLHLETAKMTSGLPIFIEKPLSHNLTGLDQLTGRILIGYCFRFNRSLIEFKQKLDGKKIKSVKIVCRSWLPDWRPNQDYRQSYSAKTALGGGVLLDLSHEIDYALWWFGPVKKVIAKLQKAPELDIETEAIADLNIEFVSGVFADIHLSYASKKAERYCKVMTDSGILRWDYQPNNEMYLAEMKHFIDVCQNKTKPLVTVVDGINVLKIIEAAKKSNQTGTIVQL